MELIEEIARILSVRGPTPMCGMPHMILALKYMYTYGSTSRYVLQRELCLTEAAAKTLLKRLARLNLIDASRQGTTLSEKGKILASGVFSRIVDIDLIPPYKIDENYWTVAVRNGKGRLATWVIRDAVIKSGGSGVLVFEKEGDALVLSDMKEKFSYEVPRNINENDVIICAFAKEKCFAKISAYGAAIEFLRK
ncbi:MAG: DUF4443 domain-containing protein [Candidatus Korarchaeota archaeon]